MQYILQNILNTCKVSPLYMVLAQNDLVRKRSGLEKFIFNIKSLIQLAQAR